MFTVSRNYRDPNSPYKWLIRKTEEPIDAAKACCSVRCTGVRFVESNRAERGFGCAIVAECQTADGEDFQPEAPEGFQTLTFDYNHFELPDGCHVSKVAELELSPNGDVFALVGELQTA